MHKMNKFLSATSLALTVAAFGCSTNQYSGNGEPGHGAANRSALPGSSSGTEGLPPMASSYVGIAQPNTDAMAEAAAQKGYQGRVLGPVNPDGVQVGVPTQPTGGQVVSPVNPQSTINPSVSSPGEQAITGGVVGGGGVAVAGTGLSVVGEKAATHPVSPPLAMTGALGVGATPANGSVVATTRATRRTVPTTARATKSARASSRKAKSLAARSIVTPGLKVQQNAKGEIVVSNVSSVPSTKASTSGVKP